MNPVMARQRSKKSYVLYHLADSSVSREQVCQYARRLATRTRPLIEERTAQSLIMALACAADVACLVYCTSTQATETDWVITHAGYFTAAKRGNLP